MIRDGHPSDVAVAGVVLGDLLVLAAGDQVPADGTVDRSDGLEVDESLLTGGGRPGAEGGGDPVRSGSIVVAGGATAVATAVGPDVYAARLTLEARRYTTTRSSSSRAPTGCCAGSRS